MAFSVGHYSMPPLMPLSGDAIEAIHQASLTILEEIGIDLMSPAMREIAARCSADVRPGEERVRFGRAVVEHYIGLAPERFTIVGRGPGRDLQIGGWFSPGTPFRIQVRVGGTKWPQALLDAPPALPEVAVRKE